MSAGGMFGQGQGPTAASCDRLVPAGPFYQLAKNTKVVETIILDQSPFLDLEREVDRLVKVANMKCEKEKATVKEQYDQELQRMKQYYEEQMSQALVGKGGGSMSVGGSISGSSGMTKDQEIESLRAQVESLMNEKAQLQNEVKETKESCRVSKACTFLLRGSSGQRIVTFEFHCSWTSRKCKIKSSS